MSSLLGAVTSAAVLVGGLGPNPVPAPTGGPRELDPNTVTPGVIGFLATAAVVLVSILLIVNLVHRMRRIRHRAAVEEAAELARQAQLRDRSLDGPDDDDEGGARGGAPLPPGPDVVQGEYREGAPERDEPGTSDSSRT